MLRLGGRASLIAALCLVFVRPTPARAAITLAPYSVEFTPIIGKNLPYDLWGTPGTLGVLGLRGAYNLGSAGGVGVAEGSFFIQHADPDRGYSADVGWRYDLIQEGLNMFLSIGFHYTYFKFEIDYDEDGVCHPENCQTDTGGHSGMFMGGGLMVPITPTVPAKFAMRFYNGPTLWLLLEIGLGFRF